MFFWAKPADGNQWIEIPPTEGSLMPGVYNIAVQSPQPHFTVVSHLRHYLRQEDGTDKLIWETEQTSRTNEEGVGWVIQNIELKAGWWQVGCRDADLVAELFGETPQNYVTFQVAAVESPRENSPQPMESTSGEIVEGIASEEFVPEEIASEEIATGSRDFLAAAASDPASLWHDTSRHAQAISEPAIANAAAANVQMNYADAHTDAHTDAPADTHLEGPLEAEEHDRAHPAPGEDFTLVQSEFTALPGQSLTLTGHTRKSGQLSITALAQDSILIQDVQRIQLQPGTQTQSFSVQLELPQHWSEHAIAGVAELHPDDGTASLSRDFTVTLGLPPQFQPSPSRSQLSFTVQQPHPSSASGFASQPISTVVNGADTNELQSILELHPLPDWNPDLQEDALLPPELAFASVRSPDRTWLRLLDFVNAAATATTTQQRYHLLNRRQADRADSPELVDGIVGEVVAVSSTQPLSELTDPEPPQTPTPQTAAPPPTATPLALDIPQPLSSGDLVGVVMRLTDGFHPACIKLWVTDSVTDTIVDGPRWILDFTEDDKGRTGITHFTVPSRVQTLQFKAIAYRDLPPPNPSNSEQLAPAATAIVHREVIPR